MAKSGVALLIVLVVLVAVQLGSATRSVPTREAVKRPKTVQEGTVLIPGIGRYEFSSHYMPDITGLDHSILAVASGQYMPGGDNTWVPNPGFEVPNPFRPGSLSP